MKDDRISRASGIAHKIVGTFAHKIVSAFAHSWIKVQNEMDIPHHSLVTECTT